MPSTPRVIRPINDVIATTTTETAVVDLLTSFDDPFTTGLVARFELENATLGNGVTSVVLYDQPGSGAPLSVQNFLSYVETGAYIDSVIHRSIPGFVVQGGGFVVDGIENNPTNPSASVVPLTTNAPVQGEFSPERSNTRGTIAYALSGGNPNSATSQFFFNLDDNSANLDTQSGGFTVFGEVLSEADLAAVDAIAALPDFNRSGQTAPNQFGNPRATDLPALHPAFTNVPLIFDPPSNTTLTSDQNLVRYRSITVSQRDELEFEIVGNTNPTLLNASIDNNQLSLDYLPGQVGVAELTVQATTLQGETIEDSFFVTVTEDEAPFLDPEPPILEEDTANEDTTNPVATSEFIQVGTEGNGPIIDLTSVEAGRAVTIRLADDTLALGEAEFDNLIGLYRIADTAGGIDTDDDGIADVQVGDAGYARAALTNRVEDFVIQAGANGDPDGNTTIDEFGDVLLVGGALYAPFMITHGARRGINTFIERNDREADGVFNDPADSLREAVAYFAFLGANPDGAEHLRLLNGDIFGFEDLPANRVTPDNDFNDAAFRLEFIV